MRSSDLASGFLDIQSHQRDTLSRTRGRLRVGANESNLERVFVMKTGGGKQRGMPAQRLLVTAAVVAPPHSVAASDNPESPRCSSPLAAMLRRAAWSRRSPEECHGGRGFAAGIFLRLWGE